MFILEARSGLGTHIQVSLHKHAEIIVHNWKISM